MRKKIFHTKADNQRRAAVSSKKLTYGFTIVELLIVIVVIAILATIAVVAFTGVQTRAEESKLQSSLRSVDTQVRNDNTHTGSYPLQASGINEGKGLPVGGTTRFQYSSDGSSYCLTATSTKLLVKAFYISSTTGAIQEGVCPGHEGPEAGINPGNWSQVSGGDRTTCGIYSGKAYCWGNNFTGALGTSGGGNKSIPTAVTTSGVLAGKEVSSIVSSNTNGTSDSHSCAIATGAVFCWGYNSNGQLGTGGTVNTNAPAATVMTGALNGLSVSEIDTGGYHTCAIANAKAYCWGRNDYGQLGHAGVIGSTAYETQPVAVDTSGVLNGKTITKIATGFKSTCALADGQAYCWGMNDYGQLGNGLTTTSNVPVAVSTSGALAGKTVTDISSSGDGASNRTTCAVADGQAYCWGRGSDGIGNDSVTTSTTPVAVSTAGILAGKTVTDIDISGVTMCAVADGKVYCWGNNSFGQLGTGTTTTAPLPVAVDTTGALNGKSITSISMGRYHTCALSNGHSYCWGYNNVGQVGDNTTVNKLSPLLVATP